MRTVLGKTFLVLTMSCLNCVAADDSLKKRFLDEAPVAWEALDRLANPIKGSTITNSKVISGSPDQKGFDQEHFYARKGMQRYLGQRYKNAVSLGFERVYVSNTNYAFRLDRKNKKDDWVLKTLGDSEEVSVELGRDERVWNVWVMIGVQSFKETIDDSTFKILDVTSNNSDSSLIDISFESELKYSTRYYPSGTVTLDPTNHWIVRKFKLVEEEIVDGKKSLGSFVGETTYDIEDDGFPTPIETKIKTKIPSLNYLEELSMKYQGFAREPEDDSKFRLPGYGLPEPENYKTNRRSSLPYYLIGICVLLGLGFLFKRFGGN